MRTVAITVFVVLILGMLTCFAFAKYPADDSASGKYLVVDATTLVIYNQRKGGKLITATEDALTDGLNRFAERGWHIADVVTIGTTPYIILER